jgi:hypothetical protein
VPLNLYYGRHSISPHPLGQYVSGSSDP